jgi:hypothetical protein
LLIRICPPTKFQSFGNALWPIIAGIRRECPSLAPLNRGHKHAAEHAALQQLATRIFCRRSGPIGKWFSITQSPFPNAKLRIAVNGQRIDAEYHVSNFTQELQITAAGKYCDAKIAYRLAGREGLLNEPACSKQFPAKFIKSRQHQMHRQDGHFFLANENQR